MRARPLFLRERRSVSTSLHHVNSDLLHRDLNIELLARIRELREPSQIEDSDKASVSSVSSFSSGNN
jgi:hypothetical protein